MTTKVYKDDAALIIRANGDKELAIPKTQNPDDQIPENALYLAVIASIESPNNVDLFTELTERFFASVQERQKGDLEKVNPE